MDKPMLVFKRFGHQIHLMVQKEAKRCGIEFMGGPQGQVVRFLDNREKNQDLVLIKDIEQELNITKSVVVIWLSVWCKIVWWNWRRVLLISGLGLFV